MKKIDGTVLASCNVFHEAHDHAIFFIDVDYDCRNVALAQSPVCLEPTLAANELVPGSVREISPCYGNGPLKSQLSNVVDDFPKHPPVAGPRVYDGDHVDRDLLHHRRRVGAGHATSRIF